MNDQKIDRFFVRLLFGGLIIFVVTFVVFTLFSPSENPEAQRAKDEKSSEKLATKERLNTCFMFSVQAAKEGTNDGSRDSPQYKEIYNAAFDRCLKFEPNPAPTPKMSGGAALESCVMSGKCDKNTSLMLNRVGEEIYGK